MLLLLKKIHSRPNYLKESEKQIPLYSDEIQVLSTSRRYQQHNNKMKIDILCCSHKQTHVQRLQDTFNQILQFTNDFVLTCAPIMLTVIKSDDQSIV